MKSSFRDLAEGFDILVIEDDNLLADMLLRGWPVPADRLKIIGNYSTSIQLVQSSELNYFDGVLIDVFLPDGDGLSILRTIRARTDIPIILMSGFGTSESRTAALEIGADGYVMKPFIVRELRAMIARLIAVRQQRSVLKARTKFEIGGGITCDVGKRLLELGEKQVQLTDAEVRILDYLSENSGKVCNKSAIYKHAFFRSFELSDKTLEVYISRIRGKIAELSLNEAKRIHSIRGYGYRLNID